MHGIGDVALVFATADTRRDHEGSEAKRCRSQPSTDEQVLPKLKDHEDAAPVDAHEGRTQRQTTLKGPEAKKPRSRCTCAEAEHGSAVKHATVRTRTTVLQTRSE